MAITLPDFSALPAIVPQPTGNLPQYPSTDAGAQGLAVLGKGLEAAGGAATDIGAYQDIVRTKMDRALADAYFTNQTIPITEQLKVETDPEKITALRGQFRTALENAGTSIGNPDARALWMAHRSEVVGRGEAEADQRNVAVVRDRHKAGIFDQANDSVRTSVGASDPQAFDLALHNIDTMAQSAVDYGSMSSVEAQNFRTKMRADLVAGRVDTLITRGQLTAAKNLLDANRGYVGGVAGAELDARIEKAGTAARTYGAGTRALGIGGGGGGGATGLIPYTPSTDILSGTGLTPDQYQTYRTYLGNRENAAGYGTMGGAGGRYAGRYQLGPNEIKETADRLGVPAPSQQQFLADPAMQERFLENYTLDHHNTLMQQSEAYRNASPTERAGILAGAHLGGVGSVKRYLDSGGKDNPPDAFGTTVDNYVTSMRQAIAGAPAAQPAASGPAARPAAAPQYDDANAPAAPAAATAAVQPGGPPGPATIEVRGDSLGGGLKGRLKAGGTAVGGARPTAILADIKKEPDSHWQGKTVVLPSGSNGNEMGVVEDTIKYLQDPTRGARVIAVGYGSKFPEKNAQLREIAGRLKVPVIDAEDVDPKEGVHPSGRGYDSMAEKIRQVAAAPSAAPAKPPGLVEAGNIVLPGPR